MNEETERMLRSVVSYTQNIERNIQQMKTELEEQLGIQFVYDADGNLTWCPPNCPERNES
jgi:hypothetical protein